MARASTKEPEIPFVDLLWQHRRLGPALDGAFRRVVQSSEFILGSELRAFEEEFAAYLGARHCVGVANGTEALHLMLRGLGIGPGDEVLVPAMTFAATAFAVAHAGAKPVFVDVEEESCTLDPAKARAALTRRTKAILPVHLYGFPARMDALGRLAREKGLLLVEDACQSHGARWRGRQTGTLGAAGAFSFYPGKNLAALGDGGAIATSDGALAEKLRLLRHYGQPVRYRHESLGYNSRLDSLQAAALRLKLRRLDAWNELRREAAEEYRRLLDGLPLRVPGPLPGAVPVYHLFTVQHESRDLLAAFLKSRGISTGLHYDRALHLQACFRGLCHRPGDFPVSERIAARTLSLPMFPGITRAQVRRVAAAVKSFLRGR